MDRQYLVRRLADNAERIGGHFAAPEAELERTYAPGKWTVRQLLAHLADCELINYWRFGRAVAEPGSPVEFFEENDWAARFDYAHRPAEIGRDLFLGARRALIHAVETLPEDRLESACSHPEKGLLPGWRWAALAIGHSEHHAGQIEAARAGKPWIKVAGPDDWMYGAAPRPA